MLWPSTRATWNPNVTMSVAYTAAEASVFNQASDFLADAIRASSVLDGEVSRGSGIGAQGVAAATDRVRQTMRCDGRRFDGRRRRRVGWDWNRSGSTGCGGGGNSS